jgi:uncharacterized protein (TIGR01319 family)
MTLAACADVGSTVTKVAIVDVDGAELVAAAEHPTTSGTDVMHGLDAALAATGRRPDVTYVCSSAGGGLRLAVLGYEPLVSAEAGRRVALSAGARVVHVAGGRLDAAGLAALRAASPDVLLLVGGTDGGDAEVLLHNAGRLGSARWRRPVVLAGNVSARTEALNALDGVPVTACANVLPRIGVLAPDPARAAIRDVFLRHVIGGKRLSRGRRFAALVRAATPDAVLTAVSLLAGTGALLAVDVGGATTDVYSVLAPAAPDPDIAAPDVAGTAWQGRTVEGDLGVRWSAPGVVAAADRGLVGSGLVGSGLVDRSLRAAADRLAADPSLRAEPAVDLALARLAAVLAVRRHALGDPVAGPGSPRRGGRDLREAVLVVGSGGVLRHAPSADAEAVLRAIVTDGPGGWPLPRAPRLVVDRRYVLAPAGLLAEDHPQAAQALLRRYILDA